MVPLPGLLAGAAVWAAGVLGHGRSLPDSYIVEFQGEVDRPALDRILEENDVRTRMAFDYRLFKGVSIDVNGPDETKRRLLQDLGDVPDIKYWPLGTRSSPTDYAVGPDRWTDDFSNLRQRDGADEEEFSPHVLAQVDKVHAEGVTGKGIKVAVIDSGIDYTHPALGGCFGPGCLVSFGTDLVGDYNGDPSTLIPDDDPRDCYGHGTHVAGIIAAQPLPNNNILGAAPGVTLGAYKISSCNWTAVPDDVTIAAFNRAFDDEADVISCSWFVGEPHAEDPLTQVVSRIVEMGTPCVLSAGNQGGQGLFSTGSPSIGRGAISVGSVENGVKPSLRYESTFWVAGGGESFTWRPQVPGGWDGDVRTVYAPRFNTCEPWTDGPELEDKVVFIPKGDCSMKKQAALSAESGAQYVIFPGDRIGSSTTLDVSKTAGIKGAALVPLKTGERWTEALDAGSEVTVGMDRSGQLVVVNEEKANGGQISSFSGWGPSWDMEVKPTVLAPGGDIVSTALVDLGGYQVRTGTSMAAPLVAGVVALMLEVRGKDLPPSRIERLLANTAQPLLYCPGKNKGKSKLDDATLAPVPQQGGGLVRAYDAVFSDEITLDKCAISFNDTEHRVESAEFTVTKAGTTSITYLISNAAAATAYLLQENGTGPGRITDDPTTLRFSPDELTLCPGQSGTVTVTASSDMADEGLLPVWSGWISVSASDGVSQRIPYTGVSGSFREHPVLDEDLGVFAFSFSASKSKERVPEGSTFVLPPPRTVDFTGDAPTSGMDAYDLTFPGLMIPFAMASRVAELSVVDAADGDAIGALPQSPFVRNKVSEARCGWDGRLADGSYVAAGAYAFRARSLRAFGDPGREEDWDTKESPVFNIEYANSIPPPGSWSPPPEAQ